MLTIQRLVKTIIDLVALIEVESVQSDHILRLFSNAKHVLSGHDVEPFVLLLVLGCLDDVSVNEVVSPVFVEHRQGLGSQDIRIISVLVCKQVILNLSVQLPVVKENSHIKPSFLTLLAFGHAFDKLVDLSLREFDVL